MAKDDYVRIVCQILVYLYALIRGKTEVSPEEYLQPMTEDFPVTETYFDFILENMLKDNLIEGITISRAWGGDVIGVYGMRKIRITGDGIHYLHDNRGMQSALKWMRDNAAVLPGMVTTAISLIQ